MAYEFHYTPTGTGAISGKEVLEQTEDAINDLGNTAISGVQEALDKAEQALTNSENAVDDAQTALNTANNAEGVAIQAQNDVSNLSGTVTNIGNRVTTAEGNITNLQGRMTTAEGNITNLQGRMTTAEGNIGNLQTAVSTAQATANSAQQTATTARQQSYVFRYSSTALTASSTNSNTLLDNTDNLKIGDKVIDSSGVLFSITAIDTQNSTFTIGTALIDLAQDGDVVHKSGVETIAGVKTFSDDITLQGTTTPVIKTISNIVQDSTGNNDSISWVVRDKTDSNTVFSQTVNKFSGQSVDWRLELTSILNGTSTTKGINLVVDPANASYRFTSRGNNTVDLGSTGNRWRGVYAVNYYYGSNNVEFSTKFVTTDTAQTISGVKIFSDSPLIYNNDSSASTPQISLKNQKVVKSSTTETGAQLIYFADKNNQGLGQIEVRVVSNGTTALNLTAYGLDSNNQNISSGVQILRSSTTANFAPNADNAVTCGRALAKWSDVQTYKINNLEPSSLSLPATTGTIDISSYITDLTGVYVNTYTPPANGYIVITCNSNDVDYIKVSNNLNFVSVVDNTNNQFTSGILGVWQPCVTGVGIQIRIKASALNSAKFIPCQGNV